MSEELKQFYVAYKEWLDAGAPDGRPFERCRGLCPNLKAFYDNSGLASDLRVEMCSQFSKAGLSEIYPFGSIDYKRRRRTETQHLHPLRVRWVEEHANA